VFLGEAEARPGYRLERLAGPDGYLALVDGCRDRDRGPSPESETEAETATVKGELFELDESELSALDHFEGEDYVRGEVHLVRESGRKLREPALALAYFKKAR
jgi:hypothetical protein